MRTIGARAGAMLLTLWLAGLAGALLVRLGPGFGIDEQELDPRLSAQTRAALRASHESERHIGHFYLHFLAGTIRGDLGVSRSLGRPVAELLRERFPTTLRTVVLGLAVGWVAGLLLAAVDHCSRSAAVDLIAAGLSGALLCLPASLLALLFVFLGAPAGLGIAALIAPRVFRYAHDLFLSAAASPHVLTAWARGLAPLPILVRHILPCVRPQLLSLAGVSLSIAFTASIPIEAICDSPGIGQLAWQAALARDLPLLVNLTLLVTAVTVVGNAMCGGKPAESEAV
jgi:peptide/nickel transport system permease protein